MGDTLLSHLYIHTHTYTQMGTHVDEHTDTCMQAGLCAKCNFYLFFHFISIFFLTMHLEKKCQSSISLCKK